MDEFKGAVSEFYAPKIHRREPIELADLDSFPRFVFREEPTGEWFGRVATGIAGILGLSALLGAFAWRSLRPRRLGVIAR